MKSCNFYPCSIFLMHQILKNSYLSAKYPKDPRIRPRRICKGSNFLFSHPITVPGVLKEATTAWTEIFLYAKKVQRWKYAIPINSHCRSTELFLNILASKYIVQRNVGITEFHCRAALQCISCTVNEALYITGSSHNERGPHKSGLILGEVAYIKVGGLREMTENTHHKT